jgi:hypothetical protein
LSARLTLALVGLLPTFVVDAIFRRIARLRPRDLQSLPPADLPERATG